MTEKKRFILECAKQGITWEECPDCLLVKAPAGYVFIGTQNSLAILFWGTYTIRGSKEKHDVYWYMNKYILAEGLVPIKEST